MIRGCDRTCHTPRRLGQGGLRGLTLMLRRQRRGFNGKKESLRGIRDGGPREDSAVEKRLVQQPAGKTATGGDEAASSRRWPCAAVASGSVELVR